MSSGLSFPWWHVFRLGECPPIVVLEPRGDMERLFATSVLRGVHDETDQMLTVTFPSFGPFPDGLTVNFHTLWRSELVCGDGYPQRLGRFWLEGNVDGGEPVYALLVLDTGKLRRREDPFVSIVFSKVELDPYGKFDLPAQCTPAVIAVVLKLAEEGRWGRMRFACAASLETPQADEALSALLGLGIIERFETHGGTQFETVMSLEDLRRISSTSIE